MDAVTFIHAADLHLGAPFKGLRAIAPEWSEVLLQAIPEAFRKVISTALAEKVDFVVIAGDVFDNSHPSYADFSLFVKGLKQLDEAGIPVYFVTGNHDPYLSWDNSFASLPPNAHLLGATKPEFICYKRDNKPLALIGGRGYYTQSWPADEDISEGISRETAINDLGIYAPFMIGVIHTGLDIDLTRSPANPKKLLKRDVDYWACGHVHQPRILPSKEDPRIVYAGCPQGRDMKEEGEHGVFKVTLCAEGASEISRKVEFIPTAKIAWQHIVLDISDCATIADIEEKIISTEFAYNAQTRVQRMIFRITLVGRSSLHTELSPEVLKDIQAVLNDGYPFFYVDSLVNKTLPCLSCKTLRKEGLFPAVYLEAMDDCRNQKEEVLLDLEKSFYQRDISLPSSLEGKYEELCDEAETLVLDLLGQDDK